MAREFLIALAGGAASGFLYSVIGAGTLSAFLLMYASSLPLFMIGFGHGLTSLIIAAVAGTAVTAGTAGLMTGGFYAATNAGPSLLIVRLALLHRTGPAGTTEWYPPGLLLTWLSKTVAGGVLVSGLLLSGGDSGFQEGVRLYLTERVGRMLSGGGQAHGSALAEALTPVFPAMVACSLILMLIVNGALAQTILTAMGRNHRPPPDYLGLRLPDRLLYGLAATGILTIVVNGPVGYMAQNIALVLAVPFFFQGLATIHTLARGWPAAVPVLVSFYLLLLVQSWLVIVVTALGVIEPFIQLRDRIARRPDGQERDK